MTKFKTNIITLFKLLTIFVIIFIILYRFRIRMPRDIFILENNTYFFCIYSIILLLNIIIFIILFLDYKQYKVPVNKNSILINSNLLLKNWLASSYSKVMDIIVDLPDIFSIIFAYITRYYIKIPLIILQLTTYIPRIFLILALSYDVFIIEKFQYSYLILYLLLLTIISKAILYISIEINVRLSKEIGKSLTIINPEKTLNNYYNNDNSTFTSSEFELSNSNKYFKTVSEALNMNHLIFYELTCLHNIENNTKVLPEILLLFRLCYIIIFGYIIYYYPINLF